MKKKLSFILILAVTTQFSFAQQAKKQFKDELFAETTVVIKDELTENDYDILNSQFDLDDIGMGEVIKIKTQTEQPVPEQPAAKIAEVEIKEVPTQVQEKVEAPAPKQIEKTVERSYEPKDYSNRKKKKKRRVKLKKRKMSFFAKNSGSCYSF